MANDKGVEIKDKPIKISVTLSPKAHHVLSMAGTARGLGVAHIATKLLNIIGEDDIVDAVLDDEEEF